MEVRWPHGVDQSATTTSGFTVALGPIPTLTHHAAFAQLTFPRFSGRVG
jgi:hypothetical protein